jgi:hypothetical protein
MKVWSPPSLSTFLEVFVETKQVVVVRGTVDMGIGNAPRFSGGRTFEHRRLYRVGETIYLSADEAARLARSGAVKAVQVG